MCGFCCLRGGAFASDIADIVSVTFPICRKNTVFVFVCFFLLGFNKINSFFLFSKLRHGMSLGIDFGVWQMMVQHLLFFGREILENHDVL